MNTAELDVLVRMFAKSIKTEQDLAQFQHMMIRTVVEVALNVEPDECLGYAKHQLNHWMMSARKGKLASVGKNQKPISELEMEPSRLKREWAATKMERGFLRKCSAYFAKGSR